MEKEIKRLVDYYMSLPYTMIIKRREEQGGYYVASYIELPDLSMTGATPEEAVRELLDEKPEWFETCIKLGIKIPQPPEPEKYSGKMVLRMSPSMHETLTRMAELEGVSLNQYMVTTLAKCVGQDEAIAGVVVKKPVKASHQPEMVREKKRKYRSK